MFLLGSADFVRRGLADGFADGRPGHAVLCGGDPVGQRLSRHVTEEEEAAVVEEEDEEAGGGVMVESGWGEPGRTIKMSLAAGKRRRRRRVVPSVRIGQRREKRRSRWWWWRTAAYTDQDPVGEFMRRPNKALNGHTSREASKNPAQGNRVAQLQK